MRTLLLTSFAIATWACSAWASDARACGTWSLEDHELKARVIFHASTVTLETSTKAPASVTKRDVIRIDDSGTADSVHSVPQGWTQAAPPPPEHTFVGRTLLLRGKPIGALTDTGFTIAARNYIVTTTRVATESHSADDVDIEPQWLVDVTLQGTSITILTGVGRTMCFGDEKELKPTDAVQRDIMLRRIAIYLAASRP